MALAAAPEKRTIAQCYGCGKKHDITDLAEQPLNFRCLDCGGFTSIYTSSQLTPDELDRYRNPATKANKEELNMAKFTLTKEEFLDQLRLGKSISDIAREQGTGDPNIHYYIKKWNIRKEVDRIQVDQKRLKEAPDPPAKITEHTTVEMELSKAKDLEIERLQEKLAETMAKDVEIERLRTELDYAIGQCEQYCKANDELKRKANSNSKDTEIERLRSELTNAMTLDRYQHLASRTANTDWDVVALRIMRNDKLLPLLEFALGAAGESGEIADEIKKIIFQGHKLDSVKMLKEIGDALWYLSQLTLTLGNSFDIVAELNIAKLQERYPEGFSEEASQHREVDAG